MKTNLSLSHDQSKDRVRPGAFVVHACSSSSSLFISKLKPGLKQYRESIISSIIEESNPNKQQTRKTCHQENKGINKNKKEIKTKAGKQASKK